LVLNDPVASYINYFSSRGRGTLERGLTRAGRYRDMIVRTLREEGVPQDLIYLAQAESGFHPLALSRAGARGMWQFMASRASGYGLGRNWWIDERQDPEKATRAAARHLKDLYNQFGDWYLAMAAYNSGPGTVQRAVQRTGYADYWELYRRGVLPAETRNYVPIILAVTIMAKNPVQYGLEGLVADSPVGSERVTINYPVDLRLVAECVDSSVSTLQELNPSLVRMTTPKDQSFDLRLPAGTKEKFQSAIAAIPADMRVWWRYQKIAPGDTLASVARKYHTTPKSIAEVNNLEGDDLRNESKLIIPVTPGRRGDSESTAFSKRPTHYKARKGDTVLSVADDFGVPAERLRKWNHLSANSLRPGRALIIYRPVVAASSESRASASPSRKRGQAAELASKSQKKGSLQASRAKVRTVRHRVRKGETLSSIAADYNTSVGELRRSNGKVASNLRPGSVLVIKSNQ
jgi:membrane-bound lytic murein transglycosylase D